MNLPSINVFDPPYEYWSYRDSTSEELQQSLRSGNGLNFRTKDRLIETISNHRDAACHIANVAANNGLESHIEDYLERSLTFQVWREKMPSKTPSCLNKYKNTYPSYDVGQVDDAINSINQKLGDDQYLFHGGLWPTTLSTYVTDRPLSTSFCPQIALRSAEWRGKAYDAGKIELFVLRSVKSITNVFVFRISGTNLSNEKEILFASGATLTVRNRILISNSYSVQKWENKPKFVPIYVLEVDIT